MKKTLTTLLALAGVAMAENIDINALDVPANWELNHANSGKNGNPTLNGGKITSGLGGSWCDWGQEYAIFTLENALALTGATDTLTLTFTYTPAETNAATTFTLIDTTNTLAVSAGQGAYSNALQMGTTSDVDGVFYNFKDKTNDSGRVKVDATSSASNVITAGNAITLTNTIAWSSTANQFVSTVKYGETVLGSVNVGESFILSAIAVGMDGSENFDVTQVDIKGSASLIPEPTTATLSLLALAGLAARRRRK